MLGGPASDVWGFVLRAAISCLWKRLHMRGAESWMAETRGTEGIWQWVRDRGGYKYSYDGSTVNLSIAYIYSRFPQCVPHCVPQDPSLIFQACNRRFPRPSQGFHQAGPYPPPFQPRSHNGKESRTFRLSSSLIILALTLSLSRQSNVQSHIRHPHRSASNR